MSLWVAIAIVVGAFIALKVLQSITEDHLMQARLFFPSGIDGDPTVYQIAAARKKAASAGVDIDRPVPRWVSGCVLLSYAVLLAGAVLVVLAVI